MKERTLQVMADVDANKLLDLIDEDICDMATLATDAEITRQFETIQKELEGILKQYLKELFDTYYLKGDATLGERQ
tara:strand:- start:180 stop:407 length:228 start_codon:yes stop_codon:yes gene_type:complete